MESYKIKLLDNNEYKCLVLATSYEDPFDDLASIESDLTYKFIDGYVIFDMLGQIGNSSERFISMFFNGVNFDQKTFKFVEVDKNDVLRKKTIDFFVENLDCLDASVLTSTDKRLITNGIFF